MTEEVSTNESNLIWTYLLWTHVTRQNSVEALRPLAAPRAVGTRPGRPGAAAFGRTRVAHVRRRRRAILGGGAAGPVDAVGHRRRDRRRRDHVRSGHGRRKLFEPWIPRRDPVQQIRAAVTVAAGLVEGLPIQRERGVPGPGPVWKSISELNLSEKHCGYLREPPREI